MMDRNLDPVFLKVRTILEETLDGAGYRLAAESHFPSAFGSADVEYRGRHERIRLVWDGKDRWLGLSVARVSASNQYPAAGDWRPLDLESSSAPQQFLREGPTTDARIAELREALVRHIAVNSRHDG
jgi:hypothetical protein